MSDRETQHMTWTSEMRRLQAEEDAIIRRTSYLFTCGWCGGPPNCSELAVDRGRCVLHWMAEFGGDIAELLARLGLPPWRPSYAHPWPDRLADGAGPRSVGPFAPCSACGAGSWCRYGAEVLCLDCAKSRASAAGKATPEQIAEYAR